MLSGSRSGLCDEKWGYYLGRWIMISRHWLRRPLRVQPSRDALRGYPLRRARGLFEHEKIPRLEEGSQGIDAWEQIGRAEFRSAEKSVEGTALRTRMGARPMAADYSPRYPSVTPLFVIGPASVDSPLRNMLDILPFAILWLLWYIDNEENDARNEGPERLST